MPQDIIETNHTISQKDVKQIKILYVILIGADVLSIFRYITTEISRIIDVDIVFLSAMIQILTIIAWVGIIIFAYIKRGNTTSTIAHSHFTNFIIVFWIGLAAMAVVAVVGGGIAFLTLGLLSFVMSLGLSAVLIWELYRLIKGLIRVMDNLPYE